MIGAVDDRTPGIGTGTRIAADATGMGVGAETDIHNGCVLHAAADFP